MCKVEATIIALLEFMRCTMCSNVIWATESDVDRDMGVCDTLLHDGVYLRGGDLLLLLLLLKLLLNLLSLLWCEILASWRLRPRAGHAWGCL